MCERFAVRLAWASLLVAFLRQPTAAAAEEVEFEQTRPGLLATYRSLIDARAPLARVERKPAFLLVDSSPHPRIPNGPFEVTWTGLLFLKEPGPFVFDAFLCGEIEIEVDGVTVLAGTGARLQDRVGPGAKLDRPYGFYPLRIRYRSLPHRPARLQIWWQGASFAREPLPAWRLMHLSDELPESAVQEQLVERGRTAVERYGCAQCHREAFPAAADVQPAPSLAGVARRVSRDWLLDWLDAPLRHDSTARMPKLFTPDRTGFVERWLVARYLIPESERAPRPENASDGDHRRGRQLFIAVGCAVCHPLPDVDPAEQPDATRRPLTRLADHWTAGELTAFLRDPLKRYPDGRMPQFPLSRNEAQSIAAYLLLWSTPPSARANNSTPRQSELDKFVRLLGASDLHDAGATLIRQKRCAACHPGLERLSEENDAPADPVPQAPAKIVFRRDRNTARGCFSGRSLPRFDLADAERKAIAAYASVAAMEKHPSLFFERQRQLARAGCMRCHQRDTDVAPAIETIGSGLGGAWLQNVPYQRTPRLNFPLQKYTKAHLLSAVRDSVSGIRPDRYTYRMPAYGDAAPELVQALAESDGELLGALDADKAKPADDPTLGTVNGPMLVGFQGYSCVSCHAWKGEMLSEPDPGAVAPDLTKVVGRIRHDWFNRFLENPERFHPGTPMPSIFPHGRPGHLKSVLDGDPAQQRNAMWSYLALGADAPSPHPAPPLPVVAPQPGEPPIVAQIPIRPSARRPIEAICLLYDTHDLIVYDVRRSTLREILVGAQVLRHAQGRLRSYASRGTPAFDLPDEAPTTVQFIGGESAATPDSMHLLGYDRRTDGARLRWQAMFDATKILIHETLRVDRRERRFIQRVRLEGIPAGAAVAWASALPNPVPRAMVGTAQLNADGRRILIHPDNRGTAEFALVLQLPSAAEPTVVERTAIAATDRLEGSLARPGYRARRYPRPKTIWGEDRIMPSAVAVDPRDGRVFVASMKLGEIFVLNNPDGDEPRFEDYARGLFQEAYSMLAEEDALYVLHRRNLTRITDTDGDGRADRFDRVAPLPHGVADTYDYAYGLVRDKTGRFVISYAPYANRALPGSGGAIRLPESGEPLHEMAYGFRNPVGWCRSAEGEIFFTDNQGEWVATNKLCHLVEGRYYGFPNPEQRQHRSRPEGHAAIWVPYSWARSINGAAFDTTAGGFGPFAGQVFMAELMFGGGIVRANLERVNGEYQGACFPFWGPGLLGPLTLAFDPRGPLYVGSITEPGWMAQPDRGALFRIDYTGTVPFEMQSIHIRPRGFRIVFTQPVDPTTAANLASYGIEHFRYEYTGAYGSPELDRTALAVERVVLAEDRRSVELEAGPLAAERVYMITAAGVRSSENEKLVFPTGAYTANELPQ